MPSATIVTTAGLTALTMSTVEFVPPASEPVLATLPTGVAGRGRSRARRRADGEVCPARREQRRGEDRTQDEARADGAALAGDRGRRGGRALVGAGV